MKALKKNKKNKEKLTSYMLLLFLVSCFFFLNLTSCKSEVEDNSDRFKEGYISNGKIISFIHYE